MKSPLITYLVLGATAFGAYLLMRRYVLSDHIENQDYIVAGALAVGLIIGQIFSNRNKK